MVKSEKFPVQSNYIKQISNAAIIVQIFHTNYQQNFSGVKPGVRKEPRAISWCVNMTLNFNLSHLDLEIC